MTNLDLLIEEKKKTINYNSSSSFSSSSALEPSVYNAVYSASYKFELALSTRQEEIKNNERRFDAFAKVNQSYIRSKVECKTYNKFGLISINYWLTHLFVIYILLYIIMFL